MKMKGKIILILLGVSFLLTIVVLHAQELDKGVVEEDKEELGDDETEMINRDEAFVRERMKEKIEMKRKNIAEKARLLKMWELMNELDLDEEKGQKLYSLMKKLEKDRQTLIEERRDYAEKLQEEVNKKEPDKSKLTELITKLQDNRSKFFDLESSHFKEVSKILSVEDQARYVIFNYKFKKKLENAINRVKKERREKTAERREKLERFSDLLDDFDL